MPYIPVPKDLTRVKTKFLFNLTKRQFVCFGGGALVMIVVMMPFFLFALYEQNGLPLEKYLLYFVRACFIRPKQRPYMTNNFYAALERQDALDREVHRIVHRKT